MENPVSTEKNWHNWRQNTVGTREEDVPLQLAANRARRFNQHCLVLRATDRPAKGWSKKRALQSTEGKRNTLASKGKVAAGSPAGQTGWCWRQTEQKAEDVERLWMEQQMAGQEAAWHALALNQVLGETSESHDCSAHAYAEGLSRRSEGNLFKKSLYSSIHERIRARGRRPGDYRPSQVLPGWLRGVAFSFIISCWIWPGAVPSQTGFINSW